MTATRQILPDLVRAGVAVLTPLSVGWWRERHALAPVEALLRRWVYLKRYHRQEWLASMGRHMDTVLFPSVTNAADWSLATSPS